MASIGKTVGIVGTGQMTREARLFEECLQERGVGVLHIALDDVLAMITDGTETLADVEWRSPQGEPIDLTKFKLDTRSPLHDVDAVLDVAPAKGPYGLWAMEVMERCGITQCNSAESLYLAKDKWRSYEAIAAAGLPAPLSALITNTEEALRVAHDMQFPIVVKDPTSSQGVGVSKADNAKQLTAALEQLDIESRPLLLQQYIECGAKDRRVVVVDNVVIDAHDRRATTPQEFRANPALGSVTQRRAAEDDEIQLVTSVARELDLAVSGMDISRVTEVLPGREHLQVGDVFWIEANGTPGFHPTDYGPGVVVDYLLRKVGV